jgi:hypothetical protein
MHAEIIPIPNGRPQSPLMGWHVVSHILRGEGDVCNGTINKKKYMHVVRGAYYVDANR